MLSEVSEYEISTPNATKINVSTIGVVGGFISMEHGFFEVLQGNIATNGIVIDAIAPGQGYWEEGGEMALTLIPNFLVTGIIAIIIGILVIIWSLKFVDRKYGALGLLILQITQLLFGGGIAFFMLGVLISVVAITINKPLKFWRKMFSGSAGTYISKSWLISIVVSTIIFVLTIMGGMFGVPFLTPIEAVDFLTTTGLIDLSLMIYTIIAGFAYNIQKNPYPKVKVI